jgi:FtsP/CotA-like multicopper oxidase with cupredoxin domain
MQRAPVVLLAPLLLAAAGCSGCSQKRPGPARGAAAIALPELPDRNPAPGVVEVDIQAQPASVALIGGPTMNLMSYGGRVPGALVRAKRGDTLVVHFTNGLPEPTTLHWHGLRGPADVAGSDAAQAPLGPGGRRDVTFTLTEAGLHWLHPLSAKQLGHGLYAPILVDDPDEPAGLGEQTVLVLSDVSPGPGGAPAPADEGGHAASVEGREGSIVLVNGQVQPVLPVRRGARQRWRLLNAARSRYFLLAAAGQTFTRIGSDGGLIERPVTTPELLLAPGERADVLLVPTGEPGTRVTVQNRPYDRGTMAAAPTTAPASDLFHLQLGSEDPAPAPAALPDPLRAIAAITSDGAPTVSVNFNYFPEQQKYLVQIHDPPTAGIPVAARVGQVQRWALVNGSELDHPFHLHGFFFQPVDLATDQAARPLQWKDTINVPAREIVDVLVRFDDRPGRWTFQCHMPEHSETGLTGTVDLQR